MRLTHRKRDELSSLLSALVREDHPLHPLLFPERRICLEYERRQAASKAARKEESARGKSVHATWEEYQTKVSR